MKASSKVDDLAARLAAASTAPLVSPPQVETRAPKAKPQGGTVQVTLRPSRDLLATYVGKAADRSKEEGRTVTAQEIMIEVLAREQA